MIAFAEEFDRNFREARRRVSDRKKPNGKATREEFAIPDATRGISLNDFQAYMPAHAYIFEPTGELWPASSVDLRLPHQQLVDRNGRPVVDKTDGKPMRIRASRWLDKNKPVEQMTWAPGKPKVIEGQLVWEGGWIQRPGSRVYNLYRPPAILPESGPVDQWLDLMRRLYGADAEHIARWLAHRVQRPYEKINHALVFGGAQGTGKDTLLVPVKQAIGPWNFSEVSPQQMLGRFNGFLKSVICRVSEARDLGDVDRYAFYDHLKTYITAPPDVLRVDEKNIREYSVPNVLASSLRATTKPMASTCRRMTGGILWRGPTLPKTISRMTIGLIFIAGTKVAAVKPWLPISLISIFPPSTPTQLT